VAAKSMRNPDQGQTMPFGLTLTQKLLYLAFLMLFSFAIMMAGPYLPGTISLIIFLALGVVLGLVTFYVSAGWGFRLEVGPHEIRISDRRKPLVIPLDKVGMLIKVSGFPFPSLWIVLKNAQMGQAFPAKLDPRVKEMLEAYRRRNPGKELTYVPVPGGYVRSLSGFAAELKQRIPPLVVDERLGVK
jgi:hypothetical protein